MRPQDVYSKLKDGADNYVGPLSTKITILKEQHGPTTSTFVVKRSRMIQYPIKSYGRIKHEYSIEVWTYIDSVETLKEGYHFNTQVECFKYFKNNAQVL